jgi:hypothetical protein
MVMNISKSGTSEALAIPVVNLHNTHIVAKLSLTTGN